MPKLSVIPHFQHENRFAGRSVCGVDEAGRGPLAGPVVAAAVIIPVERWHDAWVSRLRDSKMLAAAARAELYVDIIAHCPHGVGQASSFEIDNINILQATFLAMHRAVAALPGFGDDSVALIDGNRAPKSLTCETATLVKGDQISCSIAAASIIAKVTRDRVMAELCANYPDYGFSQHSGYGTPQHLKALTKHGPCPVHRMSFRPVADLLSPATGSKAGSIG